MRALLAISTVLILTGAFVWLDGRDMQQQLADGRALLDLAASGVAADVADDRLADLGEKMAIALFAIATGLGVGAVAWGRRARRAADDEKTKSPNPKKESGLPSGETVIPLV